MTLRDDLNNYTPRLRRYMRALATGSPAASTFADDLVHAALMRALGARQLGSQTELVIRLFATVTALHREAVDTGGATPLDGAARLALVGSPLAPAIARHSQVSAGLMALSLDDREALLLVTLEGFSHGDAARILRISRNVLLARLTSARQTLDTEWTPSPRASARSRSVPYLRVVT